MPDYSKGKIYTIRCRTDDTKIYVGSTIDELSKRWGGHKADSKRSNMLLYQVINGEWENWYIELYELYPCNNKNELCRKEGEIIRLIGTLNFIIAGRTLKEWYEDNKEKRAEYLKKYNEDNKEKRAEYLKKYYENNKEHHNNISKEWVKNNREYINKKRNEKMTCSCGCIINISSKGRHEKRKHKIKIIL
jgi:DNA modification methylase